MKMFRGQSKEVWANTLFQNGWPPYAAGQMADFLVGDRRDPPPYREITEDTRRNRRED